MQEPSQISWYREVDTEWIAELYSTWIKMGTDCYYLANWGTRFQGVWKGVPVLRPTVSLHNNGWHLSYLFLYVHWSDWISWLSPGWPSFLLSWLISVPVTRDQTLGNSSNALCNTMLELHSEERMQKQFRYLHDYCWYRWVYFSDVIKLNFYCYIIWKEWLGCD